MEKFDQVSGDAVNDTVDYIYGDLSKTSTEDLKKALAVFRGKKDDETYMRIEGELLNRKEINVRNDFVLNKSAGLRKKVDDLLDLKNIENNN